MTGILKATNIFYVQDQERLEITHMHVGKCFVGAGDRWLRQSLVGMIIFHCMVRVSIR